MQTSSSGRPSTVKFSPKCPGARSSRPSSVAQCRYDSSWYTRTARFSPPCPPRSPWPSPSTLQARTIRGPSTGCFQAPVCTTRHRHSTSLGKPAFSETSVAMTVSVRWAPENLTPAPALPRACASEPDAPWSNPSLRTPAAESGPGASRGTVERVALPGLTSVRDGLGERLFGMVAGPDGPTNRAHIHETPGPRWFADDRPIRRVHGDASMFVGGLRALLLQSLHPLAMAGVAEHSDYRGDPWGRLQRTSTFLAVTTFGPAQDAQRAVDKVRGIHRRVRGTAADGRSYDASDPHLLEWVHIAEVDSFLLAHQL